MIFYKHIKESPSLSNRGWSALPGGRVPKHVVGVAFLLQRIVMQRQLTAVLAVRKKFLR